MGPGRYPRMPGLALHVHKYPGPAISMAARRWCRRSLEKVFVFYRRGSRRHGSFFAVPGYKWPYATLEGHLRMSAGPHAPVHQTVCNLPLPGIRHARAGGMKRKGEGMVRRGADMGNTTEADCEKY